MRHWYYGDSGTRCAARRLRLISPSPRRQSFKPVPMLYYKANELLFLLLKGLPHRLDFLGRQLLFLGQVLRDLFLHTVGRSGHNLKYLLPSTRL